MQPAYSLKGKSFEKKQQCIGFTKTGKRCGAWTNGVPDPSGQPRMIYLCPKHRNQKTGF